MKIRKSTKRLLSFVLVLAILLTGISLPSNNANAQSEVISVEEAISNNTGNKTVEGYIIGTVANGPKLEKVNFVKTNLMIADSVNETNVSKMLPVQLPNNSIRTEWNLVDNPDKLGVKVQITGNLEKYFTAPGLKSPTSIVEVDGSEEPIEPSEPENITTIAEVKKGEQGQEFSIKGTVISKENAWGGNGFYIQDETAGMYVYPGSKVGVKLGDIVTLTGSLGSFGGALQLISVSYSKIEGQGEVPSARVINLSDLESESLDTLVRIENVTISGITELQYGTVEFRVTDDAGNFVQIRVDNRSGVNFNIFTEKYENGDKINVTGILCTFDGNYQVKPFDLEHFEMVEEYTGPPIDSYETLLIGEIQGLSHVSPYKGKPVKVEDAIVTRVEKNGFYIQDKGDGNPNTSDGIYVYEKNHDVEVKDKINIRGVVDEYGVDGATTTTQLTNVNYEKLGKGELPEPVIIKGDTIPNEHIDDDEMTLYEPDDDALDFWESVECMLVGIEDAKITGPVSYGTIYTLPSDTDETLNKFGGYNLKENQNPNIVPIYVGRDGNYVAKAGDTIDGLVTGVVNWEYSQPKIYAELDSEKIISSDILSDSIEITMAEDKLTIAGYNVENFSEKYTSEAKVKRIAQSIISDLNEPDIVTLVEIQDDDGQDDTGNTSGRGSGKRLTDKIVELGGIQYTYEEVQPVNNVNGGAPGANIRVAFIFNEDRVTLKNIESIGNDLEIFKGTRKSLAGTFDFKGNEVLVVGNHFNSKGGDDSLFGPNQPPVLGSVPKRIGLAKEINSYVGKKLQENPELTAVVLGDFNDFEFSEPLKTLEGDILTNLVKLHDEEDRFSYFYNGNSQTLDHILVNNEALDSTVFDMVHINSMFMEEHGRASDHDPVIAQIDFSDDQMDSNEVEISVLYMNDVHGRITYSEGSQIGSGKVKAYYDQIAGNKLLFDLGDSSQGTIEVNLTEGEPSFNLMNLMGVNATVIGNHEFDFSYERLKKNEEILKDIPMMASNIVEDETGNRPFDNTLIKDFDGVKVGVFGIATPETKYKAKPTNTIGLTFEKPVDTAKRKVKELKDQGADIIIALTHLGVDGSTKEEERAPYVLENVEGIDLLLDGHSHTIGSMEIGNGYYAQAGRYSELLGEATIKYNKETKEISIENQFNHVYTEAELEKNKNNLGYKDFYDHIGNDLREVKADEAIEQYIMELEEKVKPLKEEVVGSSEVYLEGNKPNVRTRQTNLSTIIADAMKKVSGSDVTITNGGGIRASIEKGEITKGDVLTVLPFGNTVTVIEASGKDIYEALKHGTDSYPDPKGAYPQVSGITFDIEVGEDGKAKDVVNIKINGEDLDLEKTYKVATNDFMAIGGDGYTMFEGSYQVTVLEGMAEIVMDYIKEISPITLEDESISITEIIKPSSQLDKWEYEDGEWYYYKDGERIRDKWIWAELDLDEDGKWDIDEEGKIRGNWKYFDKEGKNQELFYISNGEEWLTQKGPHKEYLKGWWENEEGYRYYFRETSGTRVEGKQWIEGEWRYFRPSGTLMTGWQWLEKAWRYLDKDGAMIKDKWIWAPLDLNRDGVSDKNNWKYFDKEGKNIEVFYKDGDMTWLSQVGPNKEYYKGFWVTQNGDVYYFRITSGTRVSGWQYINGGWRYFRSSGTMVSGRQLIDGKWYIFDNSGLLRGER